MTLGGLYFAFDDGDEDIYFVISGPENVHPPFEGRLDFHAFQVLNDGLHASFHWRSPADRGHDFIRALLRPGGLEALRAERAQLEHLRDAALQAADDDRGALDLAAHTAGADEVALALAMLPGVAPEDLVSCCAFALPLPPWAWVGVVADGEAHGGEPFIAISKPRTLADLAAFLQQLELTAEAQ